MHSNQLRGDSEGSEVVRSGFFFFFCFFLENDTPNLHDKNRKQPRRSGGKVTESRRESSGNASSRSASAYRVLRSVRAKEAAQL